VNEGVVTEHLVVFTPSGKRGRFEEGTSLLAAARALGVDLDSVCGGRGICGRCQIEVGAGSFAKFGIESAPGHVTAEGAVEERYARVRGLAAGRRLGCQARLQGDCVVDVPAESQVHRQLVRKAADARVIEIDPSVRLAYVEVREPDMHDPSGDLERLFEALTEQWDIAAPTYDFAILPSLQKALRAGEWKVTVALRDGNRVVQVWPGFHDTIYGLAVDLGSTTIALHLCDLASGEVLASTGAMNPQIRFGEDLMSRVSYAMMNPGGDAQLTAAARGALNDLAADACAEAGVAIGDVLEMVLVGNPVMHHLLLGIDPVELGGAPFALATDRPVTVPARELGLAFGLGAYVHLLPCIAGHVGADAAAVVLAEAPQTRDEISLVVDVGTNAEIVLGNSKHLLACSSPTGPAFEGAQISAGQRAAPGAIERVRIDPATLEPRFRVIGCDLWSDEPGFAEATAALGVTGICGSGIIEVLAEMFIAGILTRDGVIDGRLAARSPRVVAEGRTFSYVLVEGVPGIRVTQSDVRAIQLAKAALYAGARLLMDRLGIDQVDRVVLAGAFGSHIDPLHALILGMVPDCRVENVTSAGNAAGAGARIALLNAGARAEIAQVARRIEKVETAIEPRFQAHFVEAMAFPHKTAPYPRLGEAIRLPEPADGEGEAGAEEAGRRRRRRRDGV
jgi:uncharacterized 2Fe-2S/4Fe-4S cluster protein (DUF4445 family)